MDSGRLQDPTDSLDSNFQNTNPPRPVNYIVYHASGFCLLADLSFAPDRSQYATLFIFGRPLEDFACKLLQQMDSATS